jgi:hypothetical protein
MNKTRHMLGIYCSMVSPHHTPTHVRGQASVVRSSMTYLDPPDFTISTSCSGFLVSSPFSDWLLLGS